MATKKLIEVALPLEKINAESVREKSIRHGHPSTLHLWWARRPMTAARAVIWASLVDDPSSHPELFSSEEEQNQERQRLFKILEELVIWENSNNSRVLEAAKAEIMKSTHNNPPALLDPFAGGGAIPLEAQRLGLQAHAQDLNPVAVMINKAMIDIPSRFIDRSPINPEGQRITDTVWMGAKGIAEDVRYYGKWMKEEAYRRIGHLYPKVKLPKAKGGEEATVIAWIWARTVKCPNPRCGCIMPLASKFVLSKKRGTKAWIEPLYEDGKFHFKIHEGVCPKDKETLKIGRGAIFKCPVCLETTSDEYVKEQGKKGLMGSQLMAIVAEGRHGREYVSPSSDHELAAAVPRKEDVPSGDMPNNPRWFSPPAFGMESFQSLFTNRQLVALTTFCDLIQEARIKIEKDAIIAGLPNDHIELKDGGRGAKAYSQAISVYLSFMVDQMTNHNSTLCGWHANNQQLMNTFGRQALPMVWDYAEVNVFSNSTGSYQNLIDRMVEALQNIGFSAGGDAKQAAAQNPISYHNIMISTDPPYYDNIGYADLSDYFYIWLRRNMKDVYPELFSTILVPKSGELVATPYRFENGMPEAKKYFEDGMLVACENFARCVGDDYPTTIYYAYKQSDTEDDTDDVSASSGWETMLSSIVKAGFTITGTWPIRTEQTAALKTSINALASSIVLVCRKRSKDATICTRRNFINELKRELRPALQKLQGSNIAPVDLAQSAIGPGMGAYSKYVQVLEADGTPMTVRSALKIINQEIDLYFNEQDSELDSESRFCVDLYSQYAFNELPFGDANTLATAKNTSVAIMASHGILFAQKGKVHLIERTELPEDIDEHESSIWLLCQQLTHRMETAGVEGCAQAIVNMFGSNAERAKDLAYRLYTIAERKKWAQEAYAYNALVVAWPEIQSRAAELKAAQPEQMTMLDYLQ